MEALTVNHVAIFPFSYGMGVVQLVVEFLYRQSISSKVFRDSNHRSISTFAKCLQIFFNFLFCMLVTANNCKQHSTLLILTAMCRLSKIFFLFFSLFFSHFFFLILTCTPRLFIRQFVKTEKYY